MNNYIDERLFPYNRSNATAQKVVYGAKRRPLARNSRKQNLFVRTLKALAFIFLLVLSTFGGEKGAEHKKGAGAVESAVKSTFLYGGILLALWGVLVVLSKVIEAVTFLPMWSLIAIFALTILVAAGTIKK